MSDISIYFQASWEEEKKSHQKELDDLQERLKDLKVH